MEFLIALCIGALTAGGVFLILRRDGFSLILGLTLLSYAVNLLIFVAGRLAIGAPPILGHPPYTDPLPQALVLTAIVISFGMTAVLVALALANYQQSGDDAA